MNARSILETIEASANVWPTDMPGHVNLDAELFDVQGELPDGVHRLEGSAWQIVVENGRAVRAVREDMRAWWLPDYTTHPLEPAAAQQAGSGAG